MIRVKNANFLTSSLNINDAPSESFVEIVFLGRSNVGKSSLINALVNKKSLAKSSQTPGKTRLINFFEVIYSNEENELMSYFVDLPGFGYARVSKTQKKIWQENLHVYLEKRNAISIFIHLIDSRHIDLQIDKDVNEFLKSIKKPDQQILNVFTKKDKIKQKQLNLIKKTFKNPLLVSTLNKEGIEELNNTIYQNLVN